jgi:hypothetical protein
MQKEENEDIESRGTKTTYLRWLGGARKGGSPPMSRFLIGWMMMPPISTKSDGLLDQRPLSSVVSLHPQISFSHSRKGDIWNDIEPAIRLRDLNPPRRRTCSWRCKGSMIFRSFSVRGWYNGLPSVTSRATKKRW